MEEIRKNLGQLAYDTYGRAIGRVVGLEVDANDEVKSIKMMSDKGEFLELPMAQAKFQDNSIICLQPWEQEANEIFKQLNTINKRINALDELYRSGEIREEYYKTLKTDYEHSFEKIKNSRENMIGKMDERKQDLIKEINELQIIFASNKMQYLSGEIEEQSFKLSQDIIQRHIENASKEKNNLETIFKDIMNLDKDTMAQYIELDEYASDEFAKTEDIPKTDEYASDEFAKTEDIPKTDEYASDRTDTNENIIKEDDDQQVKKKPPDSIVVRIREDF